VLLRRVRAPVMFLPKHSRRKSLIVIVALLSALVSSCARPPKPAEEAEAPGKNDKKDKKETVTATDLDRALTEAATAALGDREGAVLVMDPHTGRLRAVVNPRLAFEQAYPPGSTIKSFTALTAMRAGLIDRESRMLCPGRFSGDGFEVVCSHPRSKSPFNLAQALGYSCNYFFAKLSGRLSFDAFKATLASAGLGARTGVNASGESPGMLRDGEWQVRNLLGEGDNLLVTPIQLLTAYCALMNGGRLFRPQIAQAEGFVADERTRLPVEPSQRSALIEGMRGAVVYGTAEKSGLSSPPIFIFGKTGTSTASNGFRRQGWFVSFAADAKSAGEVTPESLELAVLVFIKRSHGSDAAAVSQRVFGEYAKLRGGGETARGNVEPASRSEREARSPSVRVKILSENRVVTLSIEDYVVGVLSVEASVEDEAEALKAQAIVSRTYALKNLGRHAGEGFDLCSNTHCQQYVGDDSRVSEKTRRAVADTAGAVLRDASGRPADAYFHAACGGFTANFSSLWGKPGPSYLRGVRDDYCRTMPNYEWTDEIAAPQLAKALASDPITDAGSRIDDIVVTRKDATGRAEIISIEGERRRHVRGWEFKLIVGRALGWNVLKSSRFSVSRKGSSFIFRGSGFGHGLGLCQNGAHVMARRGSTSTEILNHYFPGARLPESINAKTQSREDAEGNGFSPVPVATLRLCDFALSSSQTLSSEHFRVSFPVQTPSSEVEAALRTLESARRDMFARLGPASISLPDTAVDVVIHETTQAFVASTGLPWWVAGVTHGRRIELQPLGVLRKRRILTSTLRHEYAHTVIEGIGQGRAPRWLAEGLAISFAGEGPMLRRFASKTRLSLDELERRLARPRSAGEMRELYAAAYREVRALIQRDGEASVWRRLKARASGAAA
jgi:SpoIID/LytB domain protein